MRERTLLNSATSYGALKQRFGTYEITIDGNRDEKRATSLQVMAFSPVVEHHSNRLINRTLDEYLGHSSAAIPTLRDLLSVSRWVAWRSHLNSVAPTIGQLLYAPSASA